MAKFPREGTKEVFRATLMPVSHPTPPLPPSSFIHCYLHNERMFGAAFSLGFHNAGRGPFTCSDRKSCVLETSKKRERRMMGRPRSASGGEFPSPPLYLIIKWKVPKISGCVQRGTRQSLGTETSCTCALFSGFARILIINARMSSKKARWFIRNTF